MKSSTFGLKQAKERNVGIINIEGHAFDNLLVFHSLEKKKNKQTKKWFAVYY